MPVPLYGNLSFTHNHNAAGDIGRSVGGNSHIGTHTHGTAGFHGSSASTTPGSGVFTRAYADMCIPGYGNTGTHGHGVGGINMAFTGAHSSDTAGPSHWGVKGDW
uniref:Putative ovule protein n=1 Tax=Solanum chacoense TaxID=4108 RepID=A0A0V0GLB6_SOLCH